MENIYRMEIRQKFKKALDEKNTDVLMCLIANNNIDRRLINTKSNSGLTALYIASEKNCISLVKALVEKGANLNEISVYGNTALHMASDRNNLEVAQYLIQNGANIDAQNDRGETPLYKACKINWIKMANMLLNNGANPNIADNMGRNALYSVAYYGYYKLAKLLIQRNIYVNMQDRYGESPLQCACEGGYIEMAKVLINNGADVDVKVRDKGILKWAIEREEYELVDTLVKKGAKLPIRWIIRNNKKQALKIIIDNGRFIPLHYKNTDLLAMAINENNIAIANLLMRNMSCGMEGKLEKLGELLSTKQADEILNNSNEDTKREIQTLKRERIQQEIVDILSIERNARTK